MTRLLTLLAASLFAGCATAPPPPLAATSPASPEAPEGARLARSTALRTDDSTRKTAALLSAAKKDQEQWDASGPVSGTPENAAKTSSQPEMKHEHH